ncbi:MAG: Rrf2 family transcriptional regulator [Bacteroidetes bacterium]|nr:Rrf2 family transcriptional regulator [Bacteroidota bacterium]
MMSKKTKYALKALTALARVYPQGKLTIQAIADQERIPKKFLEQILLELKRQRLVSSLQGSRGGYYLLKQPDDITLAQVYRIFDGAIALVPCVSVNFYEPCADCSDEKSCHLRRELAWVRDQADGIMSQVTLSNLLQPGDTHWSPVI